MCEGDLRWHRFVHGERAILLSEHSASMTTSTIIESHARRWLTPFEKAAQTYFPYRTSPTERESSGRLGGVRSVCAEQD
ncbi:hypothetical protein FB45DRAFT_1008026 [Roridomyces roridus]|uniref:Uncharacterized protein n=1 Tax=Roridomyces roridus TaxID=1738132 RepID=A0AAD7BC87_9AGAR|nr:hypothetical protein FB45DRAFT_1008026 [Roridomyces roridus]